MADGFSSERFARGFSRDTCSTSRECRRHARALVDILPTQEFANRLQVGNSLSLRVEQATYTAALNYTLVPTIALGDRHQILATEPWWFSLTRQVHAKAIMVSDGNQRRQ